MRCGERGERPLTLAHPEGHNNIPVQCRAATDVDRFSKILIEKLNTSDLGLPHHTLSPGDSKVLLLMATFLEIFTLGRCDWDKP